MVNTRKICIDIIFHEPIIIRTTHTQALCAIARIHYKYQTDTALYTFANPYPLHFQKVSYLLTK